MLRESIQVVCQLRSVEISMFSKEKYLKSIQKLAREESISLDECRLRNIFSRYTVDQIDRFYDACCRFGVKNIIDAAIMEERDGAQKRKSR